MLIALAIFFSLGLAFVNGGNDNLKGVATLLGSKVLSYRKALWLACISTALGALTSVFLAGALITAFGGKGLVPDAIVQSSLFITSVSAAAAITIALATRFGLPVSTTHALVGGLLGAGFALAPQALDVSVLGKTFFLPLLLSPAIAIALSLLLAPLMRKLDKPAIAKQELCLCESETLPAGDSVASVAASLSIGTQASCPPTSHNAIVSLPASKAFDFVHCLSGGAVCFARGLNDTPKMAAILVVSGLAGLSSVVAIGIAMVVGGILTARRVAKTMSEDITSMTHSEGLSANLVTSTLVILASKYGLPVSTTHVSCGALFGLAAGNGRGKLKTIFTILLSWISTLPLAAVLAFVMANLIIVLGEN
ncbi:MAG TPA: inorganic phosphate transporter [Arenimonas sp.]|nr:inorganic phosphate transporter [Arenimonas sp.]HPW31679.1 inorganic phosphate transporter [Arenimonas sp.]